LLLIAPDSYPIISSQVSLTLVNGSGDGDVLRGNVSEEGSGRHQQYRRITEGFSKQNNNVLLWPVCQIWPPTFFFVNKVL
jgi:hypothetical protein